MLDRRTFLEYGSTCGLSALLRVLGLIAPRTASAKDSDEIVREKSLNRLIEGLAGRNGVLPSALIDLKIPDVAENGAIVPIAISTTLENAYSIAVIAEKNPVPLIGRFRFEKGAEPYVQARIKMAESSHVIVLVSAGERIHVARKFVEVMVGGCGT